MCGNLSLPCLHYDFFIVASSVLRFSLWSLVSCSPGGTDLVPLDSHLAAQFQEVWATQVKILLLYPTSAKCDGFSAGCTMYSIFSAEHQLKHFQSLSQQCVFC